MEISLRDRLIVVAIWVVGFASFLLIGLDPLDILDLNQESILAVIISAVSLPLPFYHRQRIIKKTKNNLDNP